MTHPAPIDTTEYDFNDEAHLDLAASQKRQILRDWQRFMQSGFKKLFFTRSLYRFLIHRCGFSAHYNQERFWSYHFDAEISRLKALLAQFGGDNFSLEFGNQMWLADPAADLKAAMCWEASRLYDPFDQVLLDLEHKHEEMIIAWREFALNSGIREVNLPPAYTVSENTRNLLAYAAQIALREQGYPLVGLQLIFPTHHHQTLLQPVPVAAG